MRRLATACAATAVLISGCAAETGSPSTEPAPAASRTDAAPTTSQEKVKTTEDIARAAFEGMPHIQLTSVSASEGSNMVAVDAQVLSGKIPPISSEASAAALASIVDVVSPHNPGSGFEVQTPGGTQIITAGHIAKNAVEGGLDVAFYDNGGAPRPYTTFDGFITGEASSYEDIGVVSPLASGSGALSVRNTVTDPLVPGEVVYFVNYQQDGPGAPSREPGNPAVFAGILTGFSANRATVLGEVTGPHQSTWMAASGGLTMDARGQAIGASVGVDGTSVSNATESGPALPWRPGAGTVSCDSPVTASFMKDGALIDLRLSVPCGVPEAPGPFTSTAVRLAVDGGFAPQPGANHAQVAGR